MSISPVVPGKTRIGWIGLGVMGKSMCGHLISAGFSTTVYTRTASKASPLVERGAVQVASPAEVAKRSDVIFSIVGFPEDVEQITIGTNGTLNAAQPGTVLVDMTTSRPALAQRIELAAREKGVISLDAPVSGGDIGAREARLSIMVGGDRAAFDALGPCWQAMGKVIEYQGPAGSGQHTKLVNQILIASNMVGVCEAMLYAYRSGLDPIRVLQSVSSGAAGSWSLTNLAPRILNGDYAPGFFVEHFIKDMGIALEESRRLGISLPGLALAQQLYIALMAQGHSRSGTQALIHALASASGFDWKNRK